MSDVAAEAAHRESSAQPLRRDTENRVVAGVCAGLARWLGVDAILIRLVFVASVAAGGLGLVLYPAAWLLMPADGARDAAAAPARRRPGRWYVIFGIALLALSSMLYARQLGLWFSDALAWPIVLAAVGAALIWHRSSTTAVETPEAPPRAHVAPLGRIAFGVALVVGAGLLFLLWNDVGAARDVAFTAIVVAVALVLVLAPVWWRLARNLAAERAERIRSQERAELAAHLHDSVLQTLALVQHRAGDARAVAALARRQERELRAWLAGRPARSEQDSLAGALEAIAEDVEETHRVTVDVVNVGDAPLDSELEAIVAATREALVNAAKFAGEEPIAVYAEATADRVQIFVRDRGRGFDLGAVPESRRGIRESIVGRLERHGGRAKITTAPGLGTEIELVLDRRRR